MTVGELIQKLQELRRPDLRVVLDAFDHSYRNAHVELDFEYEEDGTKTIVVVIR